MYNGDDYTNVMKLLCNKKISIKADPIISITCCMPYTLLFIPMDPCVSLSYLWPWAVRGRWRPLGPAAPHSGSGPSHWSAGPPTTATNHRGRTCSWAMRRGLGRPHWPSLFHPAPPGFVSPHHRTPRSTWPAVQRGRKRTGRPSMGWRRSCRAGRKQDPSAGFSPGADGHHLQKQKQKKIESEQKRVAR